VESEEMLKEHIISQTMESVFEKSAQVKTRIEDISRNFHELKKLVCEENTT
jgi:hypothetical protein